MSVVLNGMVAHSQSDCSRLGKSMIKQLLGLAQSDRERECLHYAVFKASGMTPTQARQMYRFEHMAQRAKKVENCISEAPKIRETIESLATIEDTAFLATLGILPDYSDEESDCEELEDADSSEPKDLLPDTSEVAPGALSLEDLKVLVDSSQYNWFDMIERAEECHGVHVGEVASQLEVALSEPRRFGLDEHQLQLLLQSKHAFHMAESDAYADGRIARAIKGEVVTDSELDNPEDYVHLQDPLSKEGRVLVK